jgi:predicted Zn-ribbon and HTH transcriptional regulator
MTLDRKKQEIFIKKLQEIKPDIECPMCHNRSWEANNTIFELREFLGGKTVQAGVKEVTSYPVIPLCCSKCGYTYFINAIKIGVLEPQKMGDTKNE